MVDSHWLRRLAAIAAAILGLGAGSAQAEPPPERHPACPASEPLNGLTRTEYDGGDLLLFNGRAFVPFWETPGDNWVVDGDSIVRTSGRGPLYLRRHRLPSRFDLRFEWRADPGATGGIGYLGDQTFPLSASSEGDPSTWNCGRLVVSDRGVEQWLNGQLVASEPLPTAAAEVDLFFLRLLDGDGKLAFRNLKLSAPAGRNGVPVLEIAPLSNLAQRIELVSAAGRFAESARPALAPEASDLARRLGYPLAGTVVHPRMQLDRLGEDDHGTLYRYRVEALPGLDGIGILALPKGRAGPRPVVIAQHGGGGSPEYATWYAGNYHDMIRGPLREGFIVIAPQMLMRSPWEAAYGNTVTDSDIAAMSLRLQQNGTSYLAVEATRISAALTAVLEGQAADPKRIAMMGLSAGGTMTENLMAIEPRILVGVDGNGFGVRELDEEGGPHELLLAAIAPRPFLIVSGRHDPFASIRADVVETQMPAARRAYGSSGVLEFQVTDAGHDFEWPAARAFILRAFETVA